MVECYSECKVEHINGAWPSFLGYFVVIMVQRLHLWVESLLVEKTQARVLTSTFNNKFVCVCVEHINGQA